MSLRIAIIGCGYIATASHGPSLARYAASHSGVELAACCDVDGARAETFRHGFHFGRSYTSYLEMLQAESPDAVCLCVPERLSAEMGCRILELGCPVLLEKPPAMTVQEMDHLIAVAARTGTVHQVAFNRRHAPLVAHLKGLLRGQAVHHVDSTFTRVGRTRGDFSTTAIHAVDTLRFLLGCDYEAVRFRYREHPALGHGVADYLLDCTFTTGATGHLTISPVAGSDVERVAAYATDHSFRLGLNWGVDAPGRLRHFHRGQLVLDLDGAQLSGSSEDYVLSGFYAEDEAFFDAVRAGRQPAHDLASARQSVEIMQHLHERRAEYAHQP